MSELMPKDPVFAVRFVYPYSLSVQALRHRGAHLRDVEFGLIEASQGRIGNIVDQLILLCYAYDPATGKYGLLIFRTIQFFATLMLLGFATMYTLLYLRMRKKQTPARRQDTPVSKTTPKTAR